MAEVKDKKTKADELSIRSAAVDTGTFNVDENSVEVVFATDTPVLTRDWDTGGYFYEVLSMDPAHFRAERADSGLPVLDNHQRYGSVKKQLGSSRSWVMDKAKKQARANVALSKRKNMRGFCGDVRDGLIKNISCGYRVYKYKDITKEGDTIRTLLAIDWEAVEISFTQVQADFKSTVRAFSNVEGAAAVIAENPGVEDPDVLEPGEGARSADLTVTPDPEPEAVQTNENLNSNITRSIKMEETEEEKKLRLAAEAKLRSEAVAADRKRSAEIREAGRTAGWDEVTITKHIDNDEATPDSVRALVVKELHTSQQENLTRGVSGSGYVGSGGERVAKRAAIVEGLGIRAFGVASLGKDGPKTDMGKQFANGGHETMIDMARGLLVGEHGESIVRGMSKDEVFERAMSSTDFPLAMADVLHLNLKRQYDIVTPEWKRFGTQENFDDFRDKYSVEVDGNFEADEITEEGEYKYATFKEGGDKWRLKTYGKKVKFTRQMMINDRLGAFTNYAKFFANGMLAAHTNVVMSLFDGDGRVLGDEDTLFSELKGNLADVGGALSEDTLSDARLAFRLTKSLAGNNINIAPKYLWIPPQLETQADKLLTAIIVATKTIDTNTMRGKLTPVVDNYLTDPKAWYVMGDPSEVEMIKYGYLQGQEGIYTSQKFDFETDALIIKNRTDFAATIEDRKGMYKNPGQ